jgi:hypothetical protein
LGQLSTWAPKTLSSGLASLQWCRQTSSVVCQARTQVLIFSISLSCATPSSSKTSHQLASGSASFPSPSQGRRSSGFIKTRKASTRGTNVWWRSSPSSSPWAKPVPRGGRFQTFSRLHSSPSPRRAKGSKDYVRVCPHHRMED